MRASTATLADVGSALANAEHELVSALLKKFDVVTGLSNWSDPKHLH